MVFAKFLEARLKKTANYLTSKRRCFHESRKRHGRRQNNPDRRLKKEYDFRIINMVYLRKYSKNYCEIYLLSKGLTPVNLHRSAKNNTILVSGLAVICSSMHVFTILFTPEK